MKGKVVMSKSLKGKGNKVVDGYWEVVTEASQLKVGDRVRYTDGQDKMGYTGENDDIRIVSHIGNTVQVSRVSGDLADNDLFYPWWSKIEVWRGDLNKVECTVEGSTGVVLDVILRKSWGGEWYPIFNTKGYKGGMYIGYSKGYGRKSDCIRGIKGFCKYLGVGYRIVEGE